MKRPGKHRQWQWRRLDRDLVAVIEENLDDGTWDVIIGGRSVGRCSTREGALRLVDAIRDRKSAERVR